jgi:RNA polymerase sigma-70 factor (ECF subfamily)
VGWRDDDPDRDLVRRAQRGDRFAFELLVERHERRLFTLAARQLGSVDDAADAVQETLIRAWTSLPRFRGQARFSTWLYRICLNAVNDQHHKTTARPELPLAEDFDPADPADRAAQRELSGALQRGLAALDETYRVPLLLYDVLGRSYAEIAELLGVPEGTVKSRLFRGRAELGRTLSEGE